MRERLLQDWYWIVGGDETRAYSSKVAQYVLAADVTFAAWKAGGGIPSRIASEAELWDVLAQQFPAGIASGNATGQDAIKTRSINVLDVTTFKILFNHENRIRTLAGQPQVTAAQFIAAIKALL